MTTLSVLVALAVIVVAVVAAVTLNALLRSASRRSEDQAHRIGAASKAIDEFQDLIDGVLLRDTVPDEIKRLIIDISAVVVDRDMARALARWFEAGCPDIPDDSDNERVSALTEAFVTLRTVDREGYELANAALRMSMVTSLLQWPETAKCLYDFAHRVAGETNDESTIVAIRARRVVQSTPRIHQPLSAHAA